MVGDRHRTVRGRLRCGCWCHALAYRAGLHHDLARGIAYLDGGSHCAAGHIHDGDVLRALIGDVGGASICTDGEPVGISAYANGMADYVACRVKEFKGPWPLADDEASATVRECHDNVG